MAKAARKSPKTNVIPDLLIATRRRCCLCVYLDGDDSRKRLQIAHIDGDRSNSVESNLVPLCLDHHDEYDSTTRLSKGLTAKEIKAYKQRLIDEIENNVVDFGPAPLTPQQLDSKSENNAFAYGMLFADVSRVVAEHDPVGFISMVNMDEYDLEIDDIIFVMGNADRDNRSDELKSVFAHWFTADIAEQFDNYDALAHDIENAMHLNRNRNPIYNPMIDE